MSPATVESIPLIASSIMSKKLAEGVDALVLDVKVGNGAFMKKQVDARRLAQMMVGIGRRMDKSVQALITDMNQPLGYAVGNALEVMEVSQTLQNAGPTDLTRLSLELAARMIFLGKITPTLEEARELAAAEAAGRLGLQEVQAGGRGAGRQSAGARPVRAAAQRHRHARDHLAARRLRQRDRRRGHRHGVHHDRRRPRHARKTPSIRRWASSWKSRSARKWMPARCCAASTTPAKTASKKPPSMVEDAFRISAQQPEERELILEVVG